MPTKTLTKKDKSRALKLGLAALKVQKQYEAEQAKAKKAAADLKKAAKKVKVEDGPDDLYKVTVEGKEYLLDDSGWSAERRPSEKMRAAVKKAIREYSHKRISVEPSKSRYGSVNGVTFKDSEGRNCSYYQSSLACEDTCWLYVLDNSIHLSESKNDDLIEAMQRVSDGSSKSVTITDRYGCRFNVKPNDGGVVITILTELAFDSKGNEVKKKLTKNNVMRFDAKDANTIRSILGNFTSFERNFESD